MHEALKELCLQLYVAKRFRQAESFGFRRCQGVKDLEFTFCRLVGCRRSALVLRKTPKYYRRTTLLIVIDKPLDACELDLHRHAPEPPVPNPLDIHANHALDENHMPHEQAEHPRLFVRRVESLRTYHGATGISRTSYAYCSQVDDCTIQHV